MQSTLTRRFTQGLTFTLSYTFSKQLDNLVASPRNPFNNALEKAPGVIDHPHVGAAIFVYQLPFGAGHKINSSSRIVSAALSHWQISGLVFYSSGSPLVIGGTCTSGAFSERAIRTTTHHSREARGSTATSGAVAGMSRPRRTLIRL